MSQGGYKHAIAEIKMPVIKDQSEREARVNRGEPLSKVASAQSTKGLEAEEDLM